MDETSSEQQFRISYRQIQLSLLREKSKVILLVLVAGQKTGQQSDEILVASFIILYRLHRLMKVQCYHSVTNAIQSGLVKLTTHVYGMY